MTPEDHELVVQIVRDIDWLGMIADEFQLRTGRALDEPGRINVKLRNNGADFGAVAFGALDAETLTVEDVLGEAPAD